MIIDSNLLFSNFQAVTATAISSNVLDIWQGASPVTGDEGIGEDMWLYILVGTAATAAGAATVTFALQSSSTVDLATAPTVHYTTAAIGKATLVAGYEVAKIRIPSDLYQRYLGINYTVATGPLTAGTFYAVLVKDLQRNLIMPKAFTVDS